jgi:hypothetical protein
MATLKQEQFPDGFGNADTSFNIIEKSADINS